MTIKSELELIKRAFVKVKQDNVYLSKRIDDLEKSKEELLRLVLNERNEPVAVKTAEEEVFIGNIKSKKVHSQNCPYGRKIQNNNREIFNSIPDALKSKYKRCACVSN